MGIPSRRDRESRFRSARCDRLLGPDQQAGLGAVRSGAGRYLDARLSAGPVFEPRGIADGARSIRARALGQVGRARVRLLRDFAFTFASLYAGAAYAGSVVVHAGRVIDIEHDRVLENQAISVENGRITGIAKFTPGTDAKVIDWSQ